MIPRVASYREVVERNRAAYAPMVDERAGGKELPAWKAAEQEGFLERLRAEDRTTLLEIGAGTGRHGLWFQDAGMQVLCTDASPEMVAHCRQSGLRAEVQDFLSLWVPSPVSAVFSMNCLLHVPLADLPAVLAAIDRCLEPGGLVFWGQYGGSRREGTRDDDHYVPKRFFSSQTDEELLATAAERFELVEFHTVSLDWDDGNHFQALTLRSRQQHLHRPL